MNEEDDHLNQSKNIFKREQEYVIHSLPGK